MLKRTIRPHLLGPSRLFPNERRLLSSRWLAIDDALVPKSEADAWRAGFRKTVALMLWFTDAVATTLDLTRIEANGAIVMLLATAAGCATPDQEVTFDRWHSLVWQNVGLEPIAVKVGRLSPLRGLVGADLGFRLEPGQEKHVRSEAGEPVDPSHSTIEITSIRPGGKLLMLIGGA